jgi:hypothetical protein
MLADVDLDASGLLPLLVKLIAQYPGDDGECADYEVKNVAIHCSGFLFVYFTSMPGTGVVNRSIIELDRPRIVGHREISTTNHVP